jgi:hypothetical protein
VETPPIRFPTLNNLYAGHTFMAATAMVQAQNAKKKKKKGGKVPKKKSENLKFLLKKL